MLAGLERNRLHGLGIWHDGPGYVFVRGKPVEKARRPGRQKIRIFPSAPLEARHTRGQRHPGLAARARRLCCAAAGLIEGVVSAITFAAPSRWYGWSRGGTRMTLFVGGYGVVVNDRR